LSCLNWVLQKPTVVVDDISLRPRSLSEMNLLLGLEVHNPNRLDFTLRSFDFTFYLNGREIGTGRLEEDLLIPASATSRLQAPVAAKFKDLGDVLKTVIAAGDLTYKIEGTARVKTIFGSTDFPFSKEGRIHWTK
jgi:LEA14-like dessication related protein